MEPKYALVKLQLSVKIFTFSLIIVAYRNGQKSQLFFKKAKNFYKGEPTKWRKSIALY